MAFCRSCPAVIEWYTMDSGKKMPVDKDPHPDGNLVYDTVRDRMHVAPVGSAPVMYRSHFVTCPNAGKHRGKPR
jgi:hypothetical protein